MRKVPGFKSAGHAILVAAYVAVNLAIVFTNIDNSMGNLGNRFGWYVSIFLLTFPQPMLPYSC